MSEVRESPASRTPGVPMNEARERVLARVRTALGKERPDPRAMAQAEAYIAAHRHGPRPAKSADRVALVERFVHQAQRMATTVERITDAAEIPMAVARYLDGLVLPPLLAGQRSRSGVCWPELAELDWAAAGLAIESRPTVGNDRTGITGCYCAIAETGTLVMLSGTDTPSATILLPDTHVAVLRNERIVEGMEEAFELIRSEQSMLPRAINMVSGPSRTGDVEQTIVLGAHGPYRVHVLLLG